MKSGNGKKAAFCIGGPFLDAFENLVRDLYGLEEIIKQREDVWILVFSSRECAITAQWIMGLIGCQVTVK